MRFTVRRPRLVLQTCDELTPTATADGAVEPTFLRHSRARLLDGAAGGPRHRPHVKCPTVIKSNRRARSVVDFSTQSFRRSRSRALSFAIARFVFSRRWDPRLRRASRRCKTVNRFDSPGVRPGARSDSPVDSAADTTTPLQPLIVMWRHADLSKPFIHTGFTPSWAAVCAEEKVPHGLREIPQRLLLYRLPSGAKPGVLGASLGQLRRLL